MLHRVMLSTKQHVPHAATGVGIAVQVGPLFLSELAPYHLRGAFNTQFQLFITIGILVAQIINYANQVCVRR